MNEKPPTDTPPADRDRGPDAAQLLAAAEEGHRLTESEAMTLVRHAPQTELLASADRVRQRLHPDGVVTYVIDRNVNYSNICTSVCAFCAFYRQPGHV